MLHKRLSMISSGDVLDIFLGFKLIGMTSKWESSCILESPGRECLSGLNLISINHKVIISNFATRNSFEFISQCHSEHKKTESIAMSFSVLVLFVQCKISFLIKSSGAEMLRAKRHLETKPSESQMSQVTHSNLIGRLTPATSTARYMNETVHSMSSSHPLQSISSR